MTDSCVTQLKPAERRKMSESNKAEIVYNKSSKQAERDYFWHLLHPSLPVILSAASHHQTTKKLSQNAMQRKAMDKHNRMLLTNHQTLQNVTTKICSQVPKIKIAELLVFILLNYVPA